ncbi:MAG TPA: Fur family transcriptional regulator [Chthonomonadaceae bacterium]|nr:Fur family transcriptional regulator [Chthonomonadaceae bacterium]
MEFQDAVRRLRMAGHKLTPQRMEILRVLLNAGVPMSAQAVMARVKDTYPCVSLDTVYRNLSLLTTTEMVNQINLQNKGTALFEFQGEVHHHHAVCLECGKSFCVDSCPLPKVFPLPAEDQQFQVVSHAFEIYGYCSACRVGGAGPAPAAP